MLSTMSADATVDDTTTHTAAASLRATSPPTVVAAVHTSADMATFISKGHRFLFRRLQPSDRSDIAELARHTYEGRDFIVHAFDSWLSKSKDEQVLPIAIVYCGPAADEGGKAAESSEECTAERGLYVDHVVSIEVCTFLDGGSTSWLYGLRVHPAFRGLSLSSHLHSYMIAASQQRPHVRRLREATDRYNSVSLHLAAKHQLKPVYESAFAWVYREQHDGRLAWAERQLLKLGVNVSDVRLRDDSTDGSGWLSRGSGDDLLALRAANASHPAFAYLLQYWICYEFTAENVRLLTEDADNLHDVLVSHSSAEPAVLDVAAVSLTRFRSDFSSTIQSFSIYATDVTHCLLHLHYALQRQTPHRHDKDSYARSMYFVPTFFEQAMMNEARDEQQQQDEEAWKVDMGFVLLERRIEHN